MNSSLENGEEYDRMKKSIVISFMNGIIFKDLSSLHTVFQLRERNCGHLLSDARKEGKEKGEARFAQLTAKLLSEGLVDELMRCTEEPAYKEELYKKFNL